MKKYWMIFLCCLAIGLGACTKPENPGSGDENPEQEVDPASETQNVYKYVNSFAYNEMNLYYLWQKEIASDLKAWKDTEEPKAKVKEIRYHTGSGGKRVDIDKWTMLTDDYSGMMQSSDGGGKTSGFDFTFYYVDKSHTSLAAVVTYVYKDSPAASAGLKRSDAIKKVNGKEIPYPGYENAYNTLVGSDKYTVETYDGRSLTIEPKDMYEDPIHTVKVFDCGDKKVGYLHFTSFTLRASEDLVPVFKEFKAQGVSELILDLRYNLGGFVWTELTLASLMAPEANVLAGDVVATEVYNDKLTQYYLEKGTDTKSYFQTEFDFTSNGKHYHYSTLGANPDLKKVYVIIGTNSASASESIVCDLHPYFGKNLTLIGQQSRGKYCTGVVLSADNYFDDNADQLGVATATNGRKYAKNWGLYVMYSRYADKNGETLCMPDGLVPDVAATDKPDEKYALGDPKESMLAVALELCGYKQAAQASRYQPGMNLDPAPISLEPLTPVQDGVRIALPEQAKLR